MNYSLEKLHEEKQSYQRRNGKSVDAIADVIGKVMVTQNETIPFVVRELNWIDHLAPMFFDMCRNHFGETPIIKRQDEWHIKNYSSRIKVFSQSLWERNGRGYSIEPTYDI